jgi:orotidine-5'-phosphate decarboxylase
MKKTIQNRNPRENLIFALDIGNGREEIISWVDRLRRHVGMFKVGKEAFTLHGPELVRLIQEREGKVFLDLKFHDIPNTVAGASRAAVKLGVSMLNVHALGGKKMMAEAAVAVRRTAEETGTPKPLLLAVTVLTSLDDRDIKELGFTCSTSELALSLAKMAQDVGLSGVVASPQDIVPIRDACGQDFIIVSPAIRDAKASSHDDQKRIMSAREAIEKGADFLVVGRPIRLAENPIKAAEEMVEAISQGMSIRGLVNASPKNFRVRKGGIGQLV